jgi:hypothetical protein
MRLNNESKLRFIELYKAKPVLWDPTRLKYCNKHIIYDASEELVKAVVDFWNNLYDCLFLNFEKALQANVRVARRQNSQYNCQSLFN